jgi:multiple sugar transport system substrate-binding protein
MEDGGLQGSALGGTGIAVSALGKHIAQASAFARWVAGDEVQAGLYAAAGGQPGHAAAWDADAVNAPVLDFYRATRQTLDAAWVRPRHDGYMGYQAAASERLNHGLERGEEGRTVIADLNRMFEASL